MCNKPIASDAKLQSITSSECEALLCDNDDVCARFLVHHLPSLLYLIRFFGSHALALADGCRLLLPLTEPRIQAPPTRILSEESPYSSTVGLVLWPPEALILEKCSSCGS